MAKHICKKCGKVISDVDAFCPRCGSPTELSSGVQFIGGRPIAQVRTAGARNGYGSGLHAADRGNSRKASDSQLSHSHKDSGMFMPSERNAGRKKQGKTRSSKKKSSGVLTLVVIAGIIIISNLMPTLVNNLSYSFGGFGQVFEEIFGSSDMDDDSFSYDENQENYALNDDGLYAMSLMSAQVQNRMAYLDSDTKLPYEMSEEEFTDFFSALLLSECEELIDYYQADIGSEGAASVMTDYIDGVYTQYYAITECERGSEDYDYYWAMGFELRTNAIIRAYLKDCIEYDHEACEKYTELQTEFYSNMDDAGNYLVPDTLL